MKRSVFATALVFLVVTPLFGQTNQAHVMFAPADLKWTAGPASLPPGAQVTVLEGNPAEEGIFTIRLRMPENYRIPPHWHPAFEHVTVVEGTFALGLGEKFDRAALHELGPGGFMAMAPGTRHFALSRTGGVIQLHGMGPWQLYYVNSADDPRNRQAAAKD